MRTSPTQFIMMVYFMTRNGDLAMSTGGPRGRQWATNKWRELFTKVWTDFKNNTKRKAAKLNKSMSGIGGGPALKITLTDLELRVLALMGEQAATGMTTISEVGFEHLEQEVEMVSHNVDSNLEEEETYLWKEPSP
ncbi:hypothetical protein evm_014112 [Chilo suppressalis]|nr:hypothetical protein evm_014112 [Chilo suppressalis]